MPAIKKRSYLDIGSDIRNIAKSLPTARLNAIYGSLQRLRVEVAIPESPVLTGYLRSRWKVVPKGPNVVALRNDTRYLPDANRTSRRPGFLQKIFRAYPSLARQEARNIRFIKQGRDVVARYRSVAAVSAARVPYPYPTRIPRPRHYTGSARAPIHITVR